MIEVAGTYNTAICYTGELEPVAMEQIKTVCDRKEFADSKIRIMPDVHTGKGCSIGTLGGGNHFIEVDRSDDGTLYLVIHSGNRHIGSQVANYYQEEAHKTWEYVL